MFKKVSLDVLIEREIHRTEIELFKSHDELESAQLRVDALAKRLQRLNHTKGERALHQEPDQSQPRPGETHDQWAQRVLGLAPNTVRVSL